MKKIVLSFLFALSYGVASASHGMGGEITWTCNGTDYVFRLKFYRDCNGVPGPQSIALSTDVPGVATIPMSLVSQTDISPDGSDSSGVSACVTCSSPGPGAVEEFVFESNPVTLPGAPPAAGWNFWWVSCCRSGSLTNVANAGSYGFALHAKMYPFFGQVSGQCSDASPQFAERPSVIICTGYPFTYSPFAWDPERDSLGYSFDILLDDNGAPPTNAVPFATGYSVNSPMPGPTQNPNNVPATINPFNGLISFTSFTQGYFATCVKVSSYKCGQLVAEVFREINIVLVGGCIIPVVPQIGNNPPSITPTFADSTGAYAVYDTTVHAGDTLQFMIMAADADPHPVDTLQDVTLYSVSEQYGTGYTNPSAGCLIPPCATLTPPPPATAKGSAATQFDWITTPAHLGISFGCVYLGNVYYFLLKGTDNYCPANGQKVETMKITVVPNVPAPPVNNTGGTLSCQITGPYIFQWFLNRFAIPGATGISYTPTTSGWYQVLAFDTLSGDGNYSVAIYVTVTGVDELKGSLSEISVFPNPAAGGSFSVSMKSETRQQITVRVVDVTGREVYSSKDLAAPGEFRKDIVLSVPAGVYLVEVVNASGSVAKKTLLF